jgi:hypothetical protein
MAPVADLHPALRAHDADPTDERRGEDRRDDCGAAVGEAHGHREGVAVRERGGPVGQPCPDLHRRAQHADGEVHEVDAGGRQRPDGGVLDREPPVVRRQGQELVLAEVALEDERDAEVTGTDPVAQLDDRRLEAALVPDAQLDAGDPDRLQG